MNTINVILKQIKFNTNKFLIEKLFKKQIKSKKILNIKIGIDPTTPNLHLGHFVLIKKLKLLQQLGHNILFLLGDFTGIIGDPTGKNATRNILTKAQTKINAIKCKQQIRQLLDPKKLKVLFNSEWLKRISLFRLLNIFSKITIYKLLERNDFNTRYKSGYNISMHEFIYPVIQAYDSVVLKADIEIGGNDQLFNLLIGRELQKIFNQEPQNILTMPILEGSDGEHKMSKSLNNCINYKDKPGDMYRQLFSINDNLIYKYLTLLSIKTKPKPKPKHQCIQNHYSILLKHRYNICLKAINRKHKSIKIKQKHQYIKNHKLLKTKHNKRNTTKQIKNKEIIKTKKESQFKMYDASNIKQQIYIKKKTKNKYQHNSYSNKKQRKKTYKNADTIIKKHKDIYTDAYIQSNKNADIHKNTYKHINQNGILNKYTHTSNIKTTNKHIHNNLRIKPKPRELKRKLAIEFITYCYKKQIAKKASNFIGNKVTNNYVPINIPKLKIIINTVKKAPIIYILNKLGLVKNNSQAKDLLKNKKLRINNITINSNYNILLNKNYLLQIGNTKSAIINLLGP
ncbi:tyrosine--tRNA ligase [Candidatus Portiera aleyrodidarum]|uniref:tyrosine--tRNA ligase n=1 Tax=Candidatus Portiera aleyrodidarum TaxID=91844 RepID=UPI000C78A291|nr:tyrosine--tRNA ligase [Candidatus Portiera aleyrodidarum]AUI73059.1 tyrosine--tRNA ligase [Candidatus Portiera aleyrodidarum]